MNSQQYAEQYRAMREKGKSLDTALFKIARDMFIECEEITNARKTRTDSGFIAVLQEQNRKWIAFCKKIEKEVREESSGSVRVDPNGFRSLILKKMEFDLDTIK